MNDLKFEWDKNKAAVNKKKHGVSFDEGSTVFYDDDALESYDPDHSADEDRFLMLGLSLTTRMLVVSHCVRESDSIIRIISVRKATKFEGKTYWEKNL